MNLYKRQLKLQEKKSELPNQEKMNICKGAPIMTKSYKETLKAQLNNSEFKNEYEALEPEFQIMREMLDSRTENKISQQELSRLTGITQSDISKIENGIANPSLNTLKRLAAAFGKRVQISFVSMK